MGPEREHDYIEVALNSADMVAEHWVALKYTGSKQIPVLFISRKTGSIYEGRTPWEGYKNPETEAETYMGTTFTV